MIKPIYFPFTYVLQWAAQTLAAGFKQFIVYQPSDKKLPPEMQSWVETNVMHVCVPAAADDKTLAEVVEAFQAFARLHDDDKTLKTAALRQGAVPFFDETSASQIIADLKKGNLSDSGAEGADALLRARVFLDFAQRFDRQQAELKRGLDVNDRRSQDLLKNLSGEKDSALPVSPLTAEIKADDPGDYMARYRLQAWVRLFMKDPIDSGLLVTSSPSVFHYLIESQPSVEKLLESKALPATASDDEALTTWRDAFLAQIKQLVETERSPADDAFARWPRIENHSARHTLTLCRWPGISPADLFARVMGPQRHAPNTSHPDAGIKNTLLGLIRRQSLNP